MFHLCRTNWKSKKKKKKKGKDGRLDLYALLGLQNERWTATDAQIKLGESTQPALSPRRDIQESPHLSDKYAAAHACCMLRKHLSSAQAARGVLPREPPVLR